MRPATGVFPHAFGCVAGKEFLEFARKSHFEMMQESPLYSRSDRLGQPSNELTAAAFAEATASRGEAITP